MTRALMVFMAFLPACICVAVAGYLAAHGIDGWGWGHCYSMMIASALEEISI